MRVVVVTISLLIGFATATRAQAQGQPTWIEQVWAEGTATLRAHDILFHSEGIVVVGMAPDVTHFGEQVIRGFEEDSSAGFIMAVSRNGAYGWVRRGTSRSFPYPPAAFNVASYDGRVFTSEGFGLIFDGPFSNGGVSVNAYSAAGDLEWSTPFGTFEDWRVENQPAFIKGLGVNPQGRIYVAGLFQDTLRLGSDTLVSKPFYRDATPSVDVFLAGLAANGEIDWIETIGSDGTDNVGHILSETGNFAIGPQGNMLVGVTSRGGAIFGEGQENETVLDDTGTAIAEYAEDGTLVSVKLAEEDLGIVGDYNAARPQRIAVGPDGNLVVAWGFAQDGIFTRSVTVGDTTLTDPAFGGAFLTNHGADGELLWVRQLRSSGNEFVWDLTVDGRGNVFVGGGFDAMRLELEETILSKQDLQEDRIDGFVAKYGPDGELLWTLHAAGRHWQRVTALAADDAGNLVVAGEFEEVVNLGGIDLVSKGPASGQDLFIAMYDAATISSKEDDSPFPSETALVEAFPNPVRGRLTIRYRLSQSHNVRLSIHDLLGRHLGTLVDGVHPAGQHEATFDTRDLASGIYVYRLEGGGVTQTGKVIVAR